jgi:hypothetical protein
MWTFLIKVAIMVALSFALRPKPPSNKIKPSTLEDFELPTAEEGRPYQVLFGTRRMKGPNVVWYGDLKVTKVKK